VAGVDSVSRDGDCGGRGAGADRRDFLVPGAGAAGGLKAAFNYLPDGAGKRDLWFLLSRIEDRDLR